MKLILLLAAGAFAAQDVTPPVISLTFPDWVAHEHAIDAANGVNSAGNALAWDSNLDRGVAHKLPTWYTNEMSTRTDPDQQVTKRASVTCIVDKTATTYAQKVTNCPDPTCMATDHHDTALTCDVPRVMMISRSAANDGLHATSYDSSSTHWRHSHTDLRAAGEAWENSGDDRIASTGGFDSASAVATQQNNRDNVKDAACSAVTAASTCVPRSVLGQYLVTYTASDESGNRAEPIAFTFIFIDPAVPEFGFASTTDTVQAHSDTGHTNTMLDWPTHDGAITAGAGNAVWSDADAQVSTTRNPWGNIISKFSIDANGANVYPTLVHKYWGSTEPSSSVSDLDWTQLSGDSTGLKSFDPLETAGAATLNQDAVKNVEAGHCNQIFGGAFDSASGETSTKCTRATSTGGNWENYDLGVTATDNYRATAQIAVYSRVTTGGASTTLGTWVAHATTGARTTTLCMAHGKTHTIDWYADDEAGIFGWKHKSNPQTRRVQIYVTDNTRPTIHPLNSAGNKLRKDNSAGAWDAYTTISSTDFEGEWSGAACVAFGAGDCSATTLTQCLAKKANGCVYTKTLALQRSSCDDVAVGSCANTAGCRLHKRKTLQTATGGALTFSTEVTKCRATSGDAFVDGADHETSTILECGHSGGDTLRSTYSEEGFDIEDNNDGMNGDCTSWTQVTCASASVTKAAAAGTNAAVCTGPNTKGTGKINNSALYAASPYLATGGANQLNAEASFTDDYTVTYTYKDSANNIAAPVTRRVIVEDTTPPTLDITGDCTIQNSAGAHYNNTATHLSGDNAAADATTGGLFDHNGIAKFFKHRDDCDRAVFTVVTLHSGGCDHTNNLGSHETDTCHGRATGTKLGCPGSADAQNSNCYLGVFAWAGVEGANGQTPVTDLMGSATNYHQQFHEYIAGTYAVQYKTQDASGHTTHACRTIQNVDHTYPIIQILGSDQMTLEATHQGNYIDDGATCSDQVDGVISQNVEVSGDVVNLSKVGTYTITYNCKDSANNAAPAAQRTVVVAQTSCPKCSMHGGNVVHEASFPYSDAGASCSDVIDGDVTTLCFAAAWGSSSNAHGVAFADATIPTGGQFDGSTDWAGAGYCDAETSGATTTCSTKTTAANCFADTSCKWNTYQSCTTASNLVTDTATGSTNDGAQIGTYYITYRAKNTVGLYNDGANCRGGAVEYRRTVEVKDTLRPVITLKYTADGSTATVAQGDVGNGKGFAADHTKDLNLNDADGTNKVYPSESAAYGDQGNFVDTIAGHNAQHDLMAEESTSSVNGWVIGAIASAVAGLALLGYSTRRTAVATSVPV